MPAQAASGRGSERKDSAASMPCLTANRTSAVTVEGIGAATTPAVFTVVIWPLVA